MWSSAMIKSRAELNAEIDELAAWLPSMLNETDESCQMSEFAGRAEPIEDQAGPDDDAHVHDRLQRLLVDHCMVSADEGPCA